MGHAYELGLGDYLRILRRHYRVVLLLTVVCGTSAFLLSPGASSLREASATIKLTHQSTVASLFVDSVTWSYGDDLKTQARIVTSLPVALRVGQALGRFPEELTAADLAEDDELSERVAEFQALYDAEPIENTSLIRVTARTESGPLSVLLANAVVDTFIDEHTYGRNRQVIESRQFIESQLEDYERRLTESESRLTEFKETHLTTMSLADNALAVMNEKIADYDRRIATLEKLEKNLERRLDSADSTYLDLLSGGLEDPSVQEINDELMELQLERDRLLVLQRVDSPEVVAIDRQIASIVQRLHQEFDNALAFLRSQRAGLIATFEALPGNDAEAARLAREVRVNEDTYTLLKQRYQEALIKEAEKVQEVQVVEYAAESAPYRVPGRMARTGAGVLVGLFLGLIGALVMRTLDTSIDTVDDVETELSLPVVGMIPHFDHEQARRALLESNPGLAGHPDLDLRSSVVTRQPRVAAAEAYRSLRTNLQFAEIESRSGRTGARTFLVTSSSSGEGKTTSAVNLAVVLAQMQRQVLLVDCDMRNPQLHQFLGVDRSPGLTEVLLGTATLDQALRRGGPVTEGIERAEGLTLLASGTLPPHPAETLASSRFDEVLEELRARFDVVLLDSPPVLPVTDAAILAAKVDGVLLVHRMGRASRAALRRTRVLLDNVQAPLWGTVVNDLRGDVAGYPSEAYAAPVTSRPRPVLVRSRS